MTDEEKAENYAKGLCKTCTFDSCRHNTLQTCAIKESLKRAFLDGLKASRPKWHKVAEGDIPSCNNLVLFKTDANDYTDVDYYTGKIDSSKKFWWTGSCLGDSVSDVTAWCEIPQYTRE